MTAPKELHTWKVRLAAPETEASLTFLQGMLNRMAVSFHKYGSVADAAGVDCLASAEQRLELYMATANTEYLIDAANFLMMEFMDPCLDGADFVATDSDGSPGRVAHDGSITFARNEDV